MAIPAITREYTPGACRNSRKLMRLPPRSKMRPDSTAFLAEEFHVPNQRHKDLRFPWWNWRESPRHCHNKRRTLMSPQECKINWCTPNQLKMKHISPSLNHSQLAFHIIYNKWLDILYNNPEIPWDTHLKSIGTSISVKQYDEISGHPISSGDESWFPVFDWRGKTSFHKHLKRGFPLGICMWEGPCVLCLKWNGHRDALIRKKSKLPGRGFMHAHRSYHKMKGCLSPL